MRLVVVGSMAFDAIETPFGKTDKIIGGAATYAALSASYFTRPAGVVAVVGGDFPKEKIEILKEHGIDVEGLQIREDEKSFFWKGRYHNDMNTRDTLVTELNVLGDFDPHLPESYQSCDYLMLGNLAPQVQQQVLDRLKTRPKLVVMDTMNFWMDTAMDDLRKVLKNIDVLSVNDEEARQLSGEYSLRKAARVIREMGPKFVIIKKGEHGALLFGPERVFFAPALPLEEVFDPTGAGDTFAGGFIGHIVKQDDTSFTTMAQAVIKGSAMASFCVEKFGTERMLNLQQKEIEAREQEFYAICKV